MKLELINLLESILLYVCNIICLVIVWNNGNISIAFFQIVFLYFQLFRRSKGDFIKK